MGGPGRAAAHVELDQELDNLRAARVWCVDEGEAAMGLRFARAHWGFWVLRGHLTEGRSWLIQLLLLLDVEKMPGKLKVCDVNGQSLAYPREPEWRTS